MSSLIYYKKEITVKGSGRIFCNAKNLHPDAVALDRWKCYSLHTVGVELFFDFGCLSPLGVFSHPLGPRKEHSKETRKNNSKETENINFRPLRRSLHRLGKHTHHELQGDSYSLQFATQAIRLFLIVVSC